MIENSKAQNDPAKPGRGRPQKNEPGMVRIKGLGAARSLCQGFKAVFDFAGESDSEQGLAPFSVAIQI